MRVKTKEAIARCFLLKWMTGIRTRNHICADVVAYRFGEMPFQHPANDVGAVVVPFVSRRTTLNK